MNDLKDRLDRAAHAFVPSGHALERTMNLVERRRRRHRLRGRSISALVVILALLAVLIPVLHGGGTRPRPPSGEVPGSSAAVVAARHDGAIVLLSRTGKVLRTLVAPGAETATWGEPLSISVSPAEGTVYIGYEILSATRYAARIERVPLDGGRPVLVARGVLPAVSPDGTKLAYIQESSGRCQVMAACPPSDLHLPLIVRDLVTGSEHRLPAPVATGISRLSWSDDDVHLAASDGNVFWVVDTTTTQTAKSPLAMFPPADASPPYWSDAVYRGSSGAIAMVAFCPETVGCDQHTEVLSIDPPTQHVTVLAHLGFGTRSLSFDTTGQSFAYIGLAPGTPLPSPLYVKSCAAAVLCMGSSGTRTLVPVDRLLLWQDGSTTTLGRGYVSVAVIGGSGP